MSKLFISYRRSDSLAVAARLCERLESHFGKDNVILDIDKIPPGVDFRAFLMGKLAEVSAVLVLIGDGWLNAADESGRRLDDPNDLVRIEVEAALRRAVTIPVLVGRAAMPRPVDLPDSIKSLSDLNATSLDPGRDFNLTVDRLIKDLETNIPPLPGRSIKALTEVLSSKRPGLGAGVDNPVHTGSAVAAVNGPKPPVSALAQSPVATQRNSQVSVERFDLKPSSHSRPARGSFREISRRMDNATLAWAVRVTPLLCVGLSLSLGLWVLGWYAPDQSMVRLVNASVLLAVFCADGGIYFEWEYEEKDWQGDVMLVTAWGVGLYVALTLGWRFWNALHFEILIGSLAPAAISAVCAFFLTLLPTIAIADSPWVEEGRINLLLAMVGTIILVGLSWSLPSSSQLIILFLVVVYRCVHLFVVGSHRVAWWNPLALVVVLCGLMVNGYLPIPSALSDASRFLGIK